MTGMKRIYIAHPLYGDGSPEWGDPERNVARYLHICAEATLEGYAVVTWIHHYLMHKQGLTAGDPEFYLSRDKRLIDGCDELWVAGPPEASSGVHIEIEYARRQGIRIIYLSC